MIKKQPLLVLLLLIGIQFCFAQSQDSLARAKRRALNSNNAVLINPSYIAQFPFGDMKKRFGFNSTIGLQIGYTLPKNFMIGIEGNYLFGTKVKEDSILINVSTYPNAQHINTNGELDNVRLQESGFVIKLNIGKIFAFNAKHPSTGILAMVSGGFLQHNIWINAKERLLPQFDKTYRKGYDRMSNGPVVSMMLGFIRLERKKKLNFYGGLQFDAAFTQNRRAWNFDENRHDDTKRIDLFLGIRVGWLIPIYTNKDNVDFFY